MQYITIYMYVVLLTEYMCILPKNANMIIIIVPVFRSSVAAVLMSCEFYLPQMVAGHQV